MLAGTLFIPPSDQFWPQCARHLIRLMRPDGALNKDHTALSNTDFSALRVIVPAFGHAQLLMTAMSNELGDHFIAPRINTMSAWLTMQAPVAKLTSMLEGEREGERLMSLYGQLREHAWLKKIFSARKNTDLLPLAQTLITLSDELTLAMLPLVLDKGIGHAEQVWHQALASMTMQQALSDEAQLVWQIWTSQLDGQDAITLRFQRMLCLAENATDPLLWINPSVPDGLDRQFLMTYAKKNPVQIVSLDWRAGALADTFHAAWREITEETTETETETKTEKKALPIEPTAPLAHITTIAADSLEHEAQLAAQTIIEWILQGKSTIALIAQDRLVARRIRALLDRAHVVVSDETGWKLSTTRAAAALAAWFDVVATRADTVVLLDLLKSPFFEPTSLAHLQEKSSWVMTIEMALLRANAVAGWDAILYALEKTAPECHALAEQLKSAATQYAERRTLSEWLTLTQQTLNEFGILTRWQEDAAGLQVIQLLEKLEADCTQLPTLFSFSEWRVFINLQLEACTQIIPPLLNEESNPNVVMLPLNGARLRSFDAVLMAGCDAAHLPSPSTEMLFFTNTVRRECGLSTREQRQRQQLRDFAALLASNPEVVLSWQSQQRGEDNPVSPWIERLNLCLQRAGLSRLKQRHVQLATLSLPVIPSQRPRPTAPHLQPTTLSASGYNSFIACPYQFFATRMLGLSPLDMLSDLPEKRDYGGWLHAILKTYHDTLKAQPELYTNEKQEALLRAISQTMFDEVVQKSPAALGYRSRWERVIPAYIAWSQSHAEAGWQFELGEVWLEKKLEWDDGKITLRGQIDRIDKSREGEFAVLDYKTNPASILKKKLSDAEDQQLPFYGLLAEQKSIKISSAYYVPLELSYAKLTDVAASNYASWQQELKQAIMSNMTAIGHGAELPAQGINQVCQYCDVRGLCRKGTW